ncbi:outer membrane beta-barrel protein [Echinicola salinicaeni]|uniref:outer membrane beta-barrel protein n=1 Tax=Echinicola salinicaeni TaxID=2762757 RepID=UPI001646ABF6|nr:outer membrane beta-barrel protein [Echinicola salinicaeni]
MKEQFDKRLVEKIRDSFQDYEEPFAPGEWEKFSHAYFNKPKKRKRIAYWPFWVSGIAASLLLLFFFLPFEKEIDESLTAMREEPAIIRGLAPKNVDEVPSVIEDESRLADAFEQKVQEPARPIASDNDVSVSSANETGMITEQQKIQGERAHNIDNKIAFDLSPLAFELPEINLIPEHIEHDLNTGIAFSNEVQTEQLDEVDAQAWVEKWKNGDDDGKTNSETIIKRKREHNPFRIGVIGGPQSASNQVSGMQFSGGVISEFSLSNKLKIDVGVTYARQNIEANSSAELPEAMTMRASMAADANSFTNDYIGSEYTLSYSGLDIPINLKYKVLDKKNTNMYLITGLSSMVYLDQEGSETFSVDSKFTSNAVGDLQFASTVQEYTESYSPGSGDSNVDLGKMLNLSFGYEYNLTNGTFLSIEPFYKLPLGNLTFTNQQFSIGGVNLRMNFQFKK